MIRSIRSCVGTPSQSCSSFLSYTPGNAGCSLANRTISRRIGTRPTNGGRWKGVARPIQSATFFYSAIFAAAVVADGQVKAARRKQWDDAIEAAEREIMQTTANQADIYTSQNSAKGLPNNGRVDASVARKRREFELLCRELALEWRQKEGQVEGLSDTQTAIQPSSDIDVNTLIHPEEWSQFENWAVAQIQWHNQSLPMVDVREANQLRSLNDDEFIDNPETEEEFAVDAEISTFTHNNLQWGKLHMKARHQTFTSNKTVDSRLRLWARREQLPDYSLMAKDEYSRFVLEKMLPPEEVVDRWQSGAFDGIQGPSIHDAYNARSHMGQPVIGKPRASRRFPPQSIEADAERKAEWLLRPKSESKIEKLRLSTAKLVSRMFRAGGSFDDFSSRVRQLPEGDPLKTYIRPTIRDSIELTRRIESSFVAVALKEILSAEKAHLPVALPHYDTVDASTLNERVYLDLCRLESGEIDQVAALMSVSHNLLHAHSPPDATTFALLLSAFSDPANHRIFTAVYWEMIRSRIRPNEHCSAVILYHFSTRCDPVRFARFHSKMLGGSSGLMLANPALTNTSTVVSRFIKHHSAPHRIIQKVTPHPLTFQYIVLGLLRFLPDAAVLQYIGLQIKRGWSLSMDSLGLLIRAAAASLDWDAGKMAWQLVQMANELGEDGIGSVGGREVNIGGIIAKGGIPKDVYVAMLVLCRVCDQKQMFRDLLETAAEAGWEERDMIERTDWLYGRLEKGVEQKRYELELEKARKALELADMGPSERDGIESEEMVGGVDDDIMRYSQSHQAVASS